MRAAAGYLALCGEVDGSLDGGVDRLKAHHKGAQRKQHGEAGAADVKESIESVRMREKEETVLTKLGLKRNSSYYMDDDNI